MTRTRKEVLLGKIHGGSLNTANARIAGTTETMIGMTQAAKIRGPKGAFSVVSLSIPLFVLCSCGNAGYNPNPALYGSGSRQAQHVTIRAALDEVTEGTPFEGNWAINAPPVPGRLALYVGDASLTGVEGNCAYVGNSMIACDEQFLADFLGQHGAFAAVRVDRANEIRRHQDAFMTWILGHEVGHAIHKHPARHDAEELDAVTLTTSLCQAQELEADAFAAEKMAALPKNRILAINRMLLDLLNSEIHRKVGNVPVGVGILFDYTNRKVVEYTAAGSHPEFVLRIGRILKFMASRTNDASMENLANDFLKHMRPSEATVARQCRALFEGVP